MDEKVSIESPGFADVLLFDWAKVEERVLNGQRLSRSLKDYLTSQATLEFFYARNLETIANKLTCAASESKGTQNLVQAIKTETCRRAEQSRIFGDSIQTDIIMTTLQSTLDNHATVFQAIKSDADKILSEYTTALNEVYKVEQNIAEVGKEVLENMVEFRKMDRSISSLRTRTAARILAKSIELDGLSERYAFCTSYLNDMTHFYKKQMKIILQSVQDMDRKRLLCLQDTIRKLMVYQASHIRNAEYDLDIAIQASQTFDPEAEIADFIARVKCEQKAPFPGDVQEPLKPRHWSHLAIAARSSHPQLKKSTILPQALETAVSLVQHTQFEKFLHTATNHWMNVRKDFLDKETDSENGTVSRLEVPPSLSDFRFLVSPCNEKPKNYNVVQKIAADYDDLLTDVWNFNHDMSENLHKSLITLNEELSSSFHRNIFISSLIERQAQDRLELSSTDGLHILGLICAKILDYADMQSDVLNGLSLMILCQQFYAKELVPKDLSDAVDSDADASRKVAVDGKLSEASEYRRESSVKSDRKSFACGSYNETTWVWPHLRTVSDVSQLNAPPPQKTTPLYWFLHKPLYHCMLWNRVSFWLEALEYVLSVQAQELTIQQLKLAVKDLIDAPANEPKPEEDQGNCAAQRASDLQSLIIRTEVHNCFGSCMLVFGIPLHQATLLFDQFAKRYGISDQLRLQLHKTINVTKEEILQSVSAGMYSPFRFLPLAPKHHCPPSPSESFKTTSEPESPRDDVQSFTEPQVYSMRHSVFAE